MSDPTTPGPGGGPRGKRATRKTLLALRDALTPETRDAASRQVADRANALLAAKLPVGSVIALYAAKDTEVETLAIDGHAATHGGLRVAYPRIVPGDRRLVFHEVSRTRSRSRRGSACGSRGRMLRVVALEQISAFVIPGIAFDRAGGRIGWGRGYYDATLAAVPGALRIGLAFECQLVDHVAREPHDIPVNYIITEVATYAVV